MHELRPASGRLLAIAAERRARTRSSLKGAGASASAAYASAMVRNVGSSPSSARRVTSGAGASSPMPQRAKRPAGKVPRPHDPPSLSASWKSGDNKSSGPRNLYPSADASRYIRSISGSTSSSREALSSCLGDGQSDSTGVIDERRRGAGSAASSDQTVARSTTADRQSERKPPCRSLTNCLRISLSPGRVVRTREGASPRSRVSLSYRRRIRGVRLRAHARREPCAQKARSRRGPPL